MNYEKKYIKEFHIDAPYVDSDGITDELYEVLIEHGQNDGLIIEKACELISSYIHFSMNITPKFRSKKDHEYKSFFEKGEEYEENEWQFYIDIGTEVILVTPETKKPVNYPDFEKMLGMFKFENRNYNSLSTHEKSRHSQFRVPYGFLFSYLLDGKEF